MNQPLDYEKPDWTPDEMKPEPQFTYAQMERRIERVRKAERRFGWTALGCIVVALVCVIWLGVVL